MAQSKLPRGKILAVRGAVVDVALEIVRRNFQAVDDTLARLFEVKVPRAATSARERPPVVPANAPDFVRNVTARIMAGSGDEIR